MIVNIERGERSFPYELYVGGEIELRCPFDHKITEYIIDGISGAADAWITGHETSDPNKKVLVSLKAFTENVVLYRNAASLHEELRIEEVKPFAGPVKLTDQHGNVTWIEAKVVKKEQPEGDLDHINISVDTGFIRFIVGDCTRVLVVGRERDVLISKITLYSSDPQDQRFL